jgi:cell division protein FtsQ
MDGRGRLAKPLIWLARAVAFWRALGARRPLRAGAWPKVAGAHTGGRARTLRRSFVALVNLRPPRGLGWAATGLFLLATLSYGVVVGAHVDEVLGGLRDARDAVADAAGFGISSVAMSGDKHVSRKEILAAVGVTGKSSVLFLDVDQARERLKTNPWIADATVLKLYPDRIEISIKERAAYALWQHGGRVSVIADDGTVLEPYGSGSPSGLPIVVGVGAAVQAKPFLTALSAFPELADRIRASVLVAERRWNLRLKNGLDVRLPETGINEALARMVALDKDKKLLSRAIVAIDLRLPDRVTVELTEEAAAARAETLKDKKTAKKGGNT